MQMRLFLYISSIQLKIAKITFAMEYENSSKQLILAKDRYFRKIEGQQGSS